MSDKTETLTITVTEEVQYSRTIDVTAELLDRAEEAGHTRDLEGVGMMLEHDPDEDEVLATVENPWFVGVFDRVVTVG